MITSGTRPQKAARKLPSDFADLKSAFLERIHKKCKKIPLQLLLNWDQTAPKLVPASQWTMEKAVDKSQCLARKINMK